MRNNVYKAGNNVWRTTMGTTPCQSCKYGVMKDDHSYDMDDCCAENSIQCPVVRDSIDDLITWAEVCLVEIEWVKKENKDG